MVARLQWLTKGKRTWRVWWKLDVVGWSYSCGGRRTWSNVSAANHIKQTTKQIKHKFYIKANKCKIPDLLCI
jgi:hypothetical protein